MQNIRSLTGLRFVLASMIVIFHLEGVYLLEGRLFPTITLGSAVAFFFCLSGFVMQLAYRERIQAMGHLEYFSRRFFRLWPLHLLGLATYVVLFYPHSLVSIGDDFSVLQVGMIVFLQQAWANEQAVFLGINGPAWSISVELFFYLLFPFISGPVRFRPKAVLLGVALLTIIYLALASLLHSNDIYRNEIGLGSVVPVSRFLEFTLGALSYELFRSSTKIIDTMKKKSASFMTIAELLLVVTVVIAMSAAHIFKTTLEATSDELVVLAVWLGNFIATPVFCIGLIVFSTGTGYVAKLLSTRLLVLLGKISFAQYLLHQLIIFYFRDHVALPGIPIWLQIIAFVSTVFIASYLAYKFVEVPSIAASRGMIKRLKNKKS